MVDVVNDLYSRRIDSFADLEAPGNAIEDLVGSLVGYDFGIGNLHTERYALLFGVAFHTTENCDGVVQTFLIRHSTTFAWESNQIRATQLGAHINALMKLLFETVMHFLPDQAVRETRSRAGHHCGRQTIVPEYGNLLGSRKVNAFEADPRQHLAPLFEGKRRISPHGTHHALF